MSIKSNQSKELIQWNRHDIGMTLKDGTFRYYRYTPRNVAIRAVKIAEQEMTQKAIKAKIATCPFLSEGKEGICVNGIHCDESCDEIKKFIELIKRT